MRAHSIDQAKGTDVDVGDGEGRWEGSEVAVREHRGKGVDGAASVGGLARLHENRDWLKLNEQPSAHHPSGDIDKWVGTAGGGNKSTGNAHTVADRACWSRPAAMGRSGGQGDSEAWLFWPRRSPFARAQEPVDSESR